MRTDSYNAQPALARVNHRELGALAPDASESAHQDTAARFEALIATMLVKEMRKSLPDGFFGSGPGSDVFNGWLDDTLGRDLATNWHIDLAGMVKTNLDSKQARLDRAQNAAGGTTN